MTKRRQARPRAVVAAGVLTVGLTAGLVGPPAAVAAPAVRVPAVSAPSRAALQALAPSHVPTTLAARALPAAWRDAVARATASPVTVRVTLKPAWRVTSTGQLTMTAPGLRCVPVRLVRSGSRPATAVLVRCTPPARLTLARTTFPLRVAVKGVPRSTVSATVLFRVAAPTTMADLLKLAPLAAPPQGQQGSVGGVSFVVPNGWTATTAGDGSVTLSGTQPAGYLAQMFVLPPVTPDMSLSGNAFLASLYAELITAVKSLYPADHTVVGPTGQPLTARAMVGTTGLGRPFVGLDLQVDDASGRTVATVQAYLTVFGNHTAVPLVLNDPSDTVAPWWELIAPMGAQAAWVFGYMDYAGPDALPLDATGYRKGVVGEWGSAGGSAAVVSWYLANGRYVTGASGYVGTTNVNGHLYDITWNFAGDGAYAVLGPFLAQFPTSTTRRPSTHLIRIFTRVKNGQNVPTLCALDDAPTDPRIYELCSDQQ